MLALQNAWPLTNVELPKKLTHWNPPGTNPGTHLEQTWNKPGTNPEPTWNQPGNHLEPTWNPPGTHVEPTQSPPGTNPKPTGTRLVLIRNPPGTHPEPIWNQPGTHLETSQNPPRTHLEPTHWWTKGWKWRIFSLRPRNGVGFPKLEKDWSEWSLEANYLRLLFCRSEVPKGPTNSQRWF